MKLVLSHRTAAFATHNQTIRHHLISDKRVSLPRGFKMGLTIQDAVRLAQRLGIDERICCGVFSAPDRRATASYCSKVIPVPVNERAFVHLGAGLYIPCPELIFLEMAAELSFVELIRFGFDLCGMYIPGHGAEETVYHITPLTNSTKLQAFCKKHPGANHIKKALKAVRYIVDDSASPAESNLAIHFILPHRFGGYGAPRFTMNEEYRKSHARRLPDLYWKELKVDIEYDSDEFHDDRTRDALRRNQLQPMLKVLTATKDISGKLQLLDRLAADFFAAANLRFRNRAQDYSSKKRALHRELRQPEWYRRTPEGIYRIPDA